MNRIEFWNHEPRMPMLAPICAADVPYTNPSEKWWIVRERTKLMDSVVTSYLFYIRLQRRINNGIPNFLIIRHSNIQILNSNNDDHRTPFWLWKLMCRSRIVCENRWVWKTHGATPKHTTMKRFWHFWIISLGTNAESSIPRKKQNNIMKKKHRKTANEEHDTWACEQRLQVECVRIARDATQKIRAGPTRCSNGSVVWRILYFFVIYSDSFYSLFARAVRN